MCISNINHFLTVNCYCVMSPFAFSVFACYWKHVPVLVSTSGLFLGLTSSHMLTSLISCHALKDLRNFSMHTALCHFLILYQP